jgi:hypothetical protein
MFPPRPFPKTFNNLFLNSTLINYFLLTPYKLFLLAPYKKRLDKPPQIGFQTGNSRQVGA